MRLPTSFVRRKKVIKRLGLKNETFDWFCLLKGIVPFYPRKNLQKKKITYFTVKSVKSLMKDPVLEKIRNITEWKEKLRKTKERYFFSQVYSKFIDFPFYDFEKIIFKRFPDFFTTLKKLNEIFIFTVLSQDQIQNGNYCNKEPKKFILEVFSFFSKMNSLLKIKNLFDCGEAFHVGIELFEKNQTICIPKKNLIENNKIEKVKIVNTFVELNVGLFNLISNKLKKLNVFVDCLKDSNGQFNNPLLGIFSRVRYYILPRKKKSIFPQKALVSKKKFDILFKIFKCKHFKNVYNEKKGWIFSKNFNFPPIDGFSIGAIFYFIRNSFYLYKFISLSLKNYFFFNSTKNDKKIIFCFSTQIKKRSLICVYLNFNWISDSTNTNSFLPAFLYSFKQKTTRLLNPFFRKFKGEGKIKNFRIKFVKKKILCKEKCCKLNYVFLFENKKKDENFSITSNTKKKRIIKLTKLNFFLTKK